jgi:hypothetical protein
VNETSSTATVSPYALCRFRTSITAVMPAALLSHVAARIARPDR